MPLPIYVTIIPHQPGHNLTHLGWPSCIDLGPGSLLLLKVSGSILSGANLRGLVWLLQKKKNLVTIFH